MSGRARLGLAFRVDRHRERGDVGGKNVSSAQALIFPTVIAESEGQK